MFVASHRTERASMKKASIIGLDLAKRSFQAHGALADGSVAFRKKLTRENRPIECLAVCDAPAPGPNRACTRSRSAGTRRSMPCSPAPFLKEALQTIAGSAPAWQTSLDRRDDDGRGDKGQRQCHAD